VDRRVVGTRGLSGEVAPERGESAFEDFKPALTGSQALVEANRCLYCHDAPCMVACPTHIDIPEFIRKIATENLWSSAKTIFSANIFGMSCSRVCPVEVLCVGACVYNHQGVPPIQIGKLQRHATDVAYERGWRYFEAGPDTGKTVGLVGGGPASLACAHELRRFGHAATLYEQRPVLGGLSTWGVAPYKLQADRALEEVAWVLGIGGIEVKLGVQVGRDVSVEDLRARHDALFIGVGLGPDRHLEVPGRELGGVEGAVAFIERLKLEPLSVAGVEHAVVVGGGNTALDCVRELLGLGVAEVTLIYRGTQAEMSGYAHEWSAARTEGARVLWHALPTAYAGDHGRVNAVHYGHVDAERRPVPGSEHSLPAELVLLAIGQSKLEAALAGFPGVRLDHGRLCVDAQGWTGADGLYGGGDATNGGTEVVNAVEEGKQAARAIHRYLAPGAA
jgi:glutamate synthase (NADPH/NADH) small chain